MSVLPVQTTWTRILNTILLFLVALEPYLFNTLPFFAPEQSSTGLFDVTSSVYAVDIGGIYGILALFTHTLTTEERELVTPDLLRRYKLSRNLEILVAISSSCQPYLNFSPSAFGTMSGPQRSSYVAGEA